MEGQFWLADQPGARVQGEYSPDDGVLQLHGDELVSCMQIVSSDRDSITRTFRDDGDQAYRLHGTLDDGTAITILHASRGRCNHGVSVIQEFLFLVALEGGHVDEDDGYVDATVQYRGLSGLTWQGTTHIVGGSEAAFDATDDQVHFARIPDLSVEHIERFVVGPLNTLLTLLAARMVTPSLLRLATKAGLSLAVRRRLRDQSDATTVDVWLHPAQLTSEAVMAWYRNYDELMPLPTAVAKTIAAENLDVEIRILTLAAAAESIHRTLHDEKVMGKQEAGEIRTAAATAVPEHVRGRVEAMLGGLRDQAFGERLAWLTHRLEALGNEICGPEVYDIETRRLSKRLGRGLWLEAVKQARNGFAHQARRSPEQLREYAASMQVLYETLRWAATAWLLRDVHLSPEQIARAYSRSSAYSRFRRRLASTWPEVSLSHAAHVDLATVQLLRMVRSRR